MTMIELLQAICHAQDEARKSGADDAEVAEIRRRMINANRKETTGANYAHQWQPARQLPPERDEPEQRQMNFAPRAERKGDRFKPC